MEENKEKSKPIGYMEKYNHKKVKIVLINNSIKIGILHTNFYNKWDIELEIISNKRISQLISKRICIPKHAIVIIEELIQ